MLLLTAVAANGAGFPERADTFCKWYKDQPQSPRANTFCENRSTMSLQDRDAEIDSIMLMWQRQDGDPARRDSFERAWKKADTKTQERLRAEAKQRADRRAAEFLKSLPTATDAQLCAEVRRRGPSTTQALGELFHRRRWPARDDNSVFTRTVSIGISEQAMVCILGPALSVNRSVGSWGVHKQHVYPRGYIYTENGTVTSYQD